MVEGHSVHRVATMHRQRLVGKVFVATSPNGRFTEGAKAIHNKLFYRIEAVGKNLFAFFRSNEQDDDDDPVVVHIHFGMAGNWAVYLPEEDVPEPTGTNRLRLINTSEGITADLSAMTVNHGGMELYETKRAKLGADPLRDDADVEWLWNKVKGNKKSIGRLIMDQSFFTGPGNIYRAEILFKSGIHPDTPGMALDRNEFDVIWKHTVELLQRGYQTGSILTVDPDEAKRLGKPKMRRYIYNTKSCPRCHSRIQVWDIASRTCYACPKCQPMRMVIKDEDDDKKPAAAAANKKRGNKNKKTVSSRKNGTASASSSSKKEDCVPFNSHCARESVETRLLESGPGRLTIKEIKERLIELGVESIPKNLLKADLVQLLVEEQTKVGGGTDEREEPSTAKARSTTEGGAAVASSSSKELPILTSSEAAAAEKAAANESLAVEHIAELAPAQARRARRSRGARGASAASKEEEEKEETKPATAGAVSSPSVKKPRGGTNKRRCPPPNATDHDDPQPSMMANEVTPSPPKNKKQRLVRRTSPRRAKTCLETNE